MPSLWSFLESLFGEAMWISSDNVQDIKKYSFYWWDKKAQKITYNFASEPIQTNINILSQVLLYNLLLIGILSVSKNERPAWNWFVYKREYIASHGSHHVTSIMPAWVLKSYIRLCCLFQYPGCSSSVLFSRRISESPIGLVSS
jgi:hypothetical protein